LSSKLINILFQNLQHRATYETTTTCQQRPQN
jgi:hypothetical protein